jgi:hypothetical protein
MSQFSYDMDMDMDIGTCCYCGEECNACSQSCGSCARSMNAISLGWDSVTYPLPKEHFLFKIKILEDIKEQTFRDDNYNGQIRYTGIGSNSQTEYMNEIDFRKKIWLNKDNFNEKCPYDPRSCSLRILVKWTGAELLPY